MPEILWLGIMIVFLGYALRGPRRKHGRTPEQPPRKPMGRAPARLSW